MSKTHSQPEKELYRRTDEVLHYLWDPIGVAEEPEARDEYYSYLPRVYSLLIKSKDGSDIADYLTSVERDMMGLGISEQSKKNALKIAELLIDYRDYIKEKSEPAASVDR